MKKKKNTVIIGAALCALALLTACGAKNITTPTPTETPQQKMAKANAALAVANNGAVQVTASLCATAVLTPAQCSEVMAIEASVANFNTGAASILSQPNATWAQMTPQLVALAASIPPASVLQKYTGMTGVQFQALVTSLTTVESTIQTIVVLETQ